LTAVVPWEGPTPGSGADLAPEADAESVARAIVLRKLTAAPRTRAQLADDLLERDVPAEVTERVLDRFAEVGLIDDAAFAQAWVRSRQAGRGLARSALRRELRGRGVDADVVEGALAEVDVGQEQQAAAALVARRLPATRGQPVERRMRRLVGMLARKGYSPAMAAVVVREALGAEASADQGDSSP
jgi:regulatory protein